jgi:hypothetical protein
MKTTTQQQPHPDGHKFSPELQVVLKEMCRRVGADFNKIVFKDYGETRSTWYNDYQWTEAEQDRFRQWLTRYLRTKSGSKLLGLPSERNSKEYRSKAVGVFIMMFGFKTIRD